MTCFNRKEKTVKCVAGLINQTIMNGFDLYICDDGSTDGTADAIKSIFPAAIILKGSGNLFWSRGMHVAMKAAVEKGYDLYLMINDDVEFFSTMWDSMYQAYLDNPKSGIVGCTVAKSTGKQSYGGSNFIVNHKGDYIGPMLAPKDDEYVKCDLANWNCFLIDKAIVEEIGLIDNRYEHAMGDFDYSFRMRKVGYNLVLAKEYVGYCENNSIGNTFKDKQLGRRKRIEKLFAANGLPVKSWYYFTKTFYEHGHIKNFLVPYIKYLDCILFGKDCK